MTEERMLGILNNISFGQVIGSKDEEAIRQAHDFIEQVLIVKKVLREIMKENNKSGSIGRLYQNDNFAFILQFLP